MEVYGCVTNCSIRFLLLTLFNAVFLLNYQSSAPVELTEAETEYAVNVVKHVFDGHIVFQYNCTNTIPEQLLENVMACY